MTLHKLHNSDLTHINLEIIHIIYKYLDIQASDVFVFDKK